MKKDLRMTQTLTRPIRTVLTPHGTLTIEKSATKSPKKSPTKPASKADSSWKNLAYLSGFGNHFESEAKKGALVKG